MDVSKIIQPGVKRLDLTDKLGPGEFVTLKVIPLKKRYELMDIASGGYDTKKAMEILGNKGLLAKETLQKLQDDPNEMFKAFTPEELKSLIKDVDLAKTFDMKVQTLTAGVDPKDHSFTDGSGKPVELNKKFWENLATAAMDVFEYIYTEVDAYQKEYSLGEKTGRISTIPSEIS